MEFSTFDWVTSYLFNFLMWLTTSALYLKMRPGLRGNENVRALKAYGWAWLFFASVSAIYMNHYRDPKDFYLDNIADAVLVYCVVAVASGLLYPRLFRAPQ